MVTLNNITLIYQQPIKRNNMKNSRLTNGQRLELRQRVLIAKKEKESFNSTMAKQNRLIFAATIIVVLTITIINVI